MIQATCSCGWTMAGPPADSWEIDQAIDEHDVWCPENDWVDDEIEGQQIERDRIIGKIRATFSPECADHIVDVITRNMKSDHGNPAKSSPVIAPNPSHLQEERAMINITQPTPQRVVTEDANGDYYIDSPAGRGGPYTDRDHAEQIAAVLDEVLPADEEQRSAWDPIWCVDHFRDEDMTTHAGAKVHAKIQKVTAHSRIEHYTYDEPDAGVHDPYEGQTLGILFIETDFMGEVRMTLPELDSLITALTTTRQQLIEVADD